MVQMTMISKKFLLFEVSISNRPVFCADRESAIENCDKRIFWPPEGREVEPPTPKNLQTAITRLIFAQIIFLLHGPLLGSIGASYKRKRKSVKICFLDLNLPCFRVRWPS